ncbi:Histone-lysine N-methyltransferase ashr1 [Ranunculus cassubicifolius]
MEGLQKAVSTVHGLTISTNTAKGRCLITTKDFSPGDILISQSPYASVPTNSSGSRCDRCFSSINLKKCSGCQVPWYCSTNCQKLEWELHRLECHSLKRLSKDRRQSLTPSIRLMVRLCVRRKLELEQAISVTATENYKLVEALVDHISDIDEKQLVLYAQMANLVNLVLQWPEINIKEIARNFSKLACNAHTICDSELRPMGTGLYPVVSIINHSCLPNSVLVFEGSVAVVRAVEFVPKGTEVLITYIETAGSTATRQKTLQEQYLFTCTCPRCLQLGLYEDIEESAILEGFRCKDDKCNGFLLRDLDDKGFLCQKCGTLRKKEDIQNIATEVNFMEEKASKYLSSGNFHDAASMYKKIEALQVKLCHSFSIDLMRTRESLLKACMELNDWKGALTYCKMTFPVYQRVYPSIHPLLGLQYYTCGKIEWLLGDTENAIKSLCKAVDTLRITHGAHTAFVKDLLARLDEAHAEAAYKVEHIPD